MLKPIQIVKTLSNKNLLDSWKQRYQIDLSSLSSLKELTCEEIFKVTSPEGRVNTVAKLKDFSLEIFNQLAWLQTKSLHAYIPDVLDFNEARQITESAFLVYQKILTIYQQQSLNTTTLQRQRLEENLIASWDLPPIEELAYSLEPILMKFQEKHTASKDWRVIGFMTTQLKFTNKLILNKITLIEQVLLAPYLKFVEEQVSIPWQRICTAGSRYELGSKALIIVEQMLPICEDIAKTVYCKLVKLFPNYRSRSGYLTTPSVAHSSMRDLQMFQAYLWLCFLEQDLAPVRDELVELCIMVMEKVEVQWEIMQKWIQLLMDEVISCLQTDDQFIVLPYVQGMQEAFHSRKF